MAIATLHSFVFDCPDPRALAEFYKELLGWEIVRDDTDWVTIGDGGPVQMAFQRAADYVPPAWPQPDHPQQAHLDVTVADLVEAGKEGHGAGGGQAPPPAGQREGLRRLSRPGGPPVLPLRLTAYIP